MRTFILALILTVSLYALNNIPTGSTTQFDVRTTGNDANGGAFITTGTGTDYSQQDAPQFTYVDLVIGTPNTTVTSVAFPFTSAAPGNVIHITSGTGFTTGYYVVTGVVGVVATVNAAMGTIGSTSGHGVLGGSLLTLGQANTLVQNGNVVNVKAGTYTLTTNIGLLYAFGWIGYQTTHGDNGTKPLITTATNSTILFTCSAANNQPNQNSFQNFSFSNTASTRAAAININNVGSQQNMVQIANGVFSGFSSAIDATASNTGLTMTKVEIKNSVSHGILATSTGNSASTVFCQTCYIHDNGGAGISTTNQVYTSLVNSIVAVNGANGIVLGGAATKGMLQLVNSVIANNTTDGVQNNTSTVPVASTNSIFYGNTRYNINFVAAILGDPAIIGFNNAYGGAGTANFNNVLGSPGDIALNASPFTSATNFALNATANGGALLKGTGYPGLFPGGTTTGYLDVGAAQSQCAAKIAGYSLVGMLQ